MKMILWKWKRKKKMMRRIVFEKINGEKYWKI